MIVPYVRLILSIAFTVVSATFLLVAVAERGNASELSGPYMAVVLVAGGLLVWCKR